MSIQENKQLDFYQRKEKFSCAEIFMPSMLEMFTDKNNLPIIRLEFFFFDIFCLRKPICIHILGNISFPATIIYFLCFGNVK